MRKLTLVLMFLGSLVGTALAADQPSWVKAWAKYNQAASLISSGKNDKNEWQFDQSKINTHKAVAERLLNEATGLMGAAENKEHVVGRATDSVCTFGRAVKKALLAIQKGADFANNAKYPY